MTVYLNKKGWRYDFMVAGARHTGAWYPTKKSAQSAEHKRREAVQKGDRSDAISTFGELTDAYLTSSTHTKSPAWVYQLKMKLNKGFGHLAKLPLTELRAKHIEAVLLNLSQSGAKPRKVNEYRKIILALLNYAVKIEALEKNPALKLGKVPEPEAPVQPIETAHLQQLILATTGELRAVLIFLSQTGARWVEAERLVWSEVLTDQPEPFCVLTTRKRRGGHEKKRPCPLTATALRAIESMRGQSPTLVFPSRDGAPMSYQTLFHQLKRLCDRLDLPHYSFHQIRHWAGMVTTSMGRSKKAVADFLGQTDTGATERYMHAAKPELWEVARRLEQEIDLREEVEKAREN
jgi:integrase